MGRVHSFRESITSYLGPPKTPEETEPNDDFSLPPEQEAYYRGSREGAEHREKLTSLKGQAAKNNYIRGLREGLKQDDKPKRGDLDNPLRKDMPREPRQPRAPRPGHEIRQAQSRAKAFASLARKASGKRR